MEVKKVNLLDVNISDVTYEQIIEDAGNCIRQGRKTTLLSVNVHTFMEAINNGSYREALNSAAISFPDGVPVLWACQLLVGGKLSERIFGPELMLRVLKLSAENGYTNFILGGTTFELGRAKGILNKLLPNLKIVGTISPPFRKLSMDEESELINTINKTKPDILWVALGAPKQEEWVYKYKDKLDVPVIAAVGAAIKYHAKIIRKAPLWMHNYGLEWGWRLLQEPKWLWRRYLFTNAQFIWLIAKELLKKKCCCQ